ncbi:RHS repeat-associated core domain-containing protein, partial [Burkholderia ubonensis]|uniref:RHS repeat-associated core domain-containing protein n=1 Tax=Burkholderia ubonensis TaxID=101571 RepID=UPI000AD83AB2
AAFIATGTDGRFVQVPAKTRHATLFYQNDHLGTPQELLDESGKVVWLGRYRAWGGEKTVWQAQPEPNEAGNPIRFPGQYHDDETGLHYNRHRYYDPNCGRFISKDPTGLAGGINVYAYGRNPITWIDPLGLEGEDLGVIYRGGSRTPVNLTPRTQDVTGLSANVKPVPGKSVVIDTSRLNLLCAICDNKKTGHVSIKPKDPSQMAGWIQSRAEGGDHPLTKELENAVVGVMKK